MAKSWHFPRWRRIVMQATMWLALGASVGLAAIVVHYRNAAPPAGGLGTMIHVGDVYLRPPAGWTGAAGGGNAVVGTWRVEGELPRKLILYRERVPFLISPRDYLARGPLLAGMNGKVALSAIPMAGGRGLMVANHMDLPVPNSDQVLSAYQIVATAILPSRVAVTLELAGVERQRTDAAETLLRQVAESLSVGGPGANPHP